MPAGVEFLTLGTLVLDELQFSSGHQVVDVVGGSGVYFTLGARLFLPSPRSGKVGWMIRTGEDCPLEVEEALQSWETGLLLCRDAILLTARSVLKYTDTTFGPKEFRYLTKPSMTRPMHLKDTRLLSSTIIHLLLGPLDAIDQIQELLCLRQAAAITERPVLIWEPAPLSCLPENLDVCLQAAKLVDIFSPNHLELASFFGVETPQRFDRNIFKDLASKCLANGIGPHNSGTVVVRAGEEGCCIYSRRQKHMVWLPAYYGRSDAALSAPSGKIVDPTGCGNAFLGAYAVGLLETQDDTQAAYYGTVASSFALEQIGPPKKRIHPDGEELWNDVSVSSRLEEFIARVDCGVTMLEP